MRILLADDKANIRDVYRSLLELAGHIVVTADSALVVTAHDLPDASDRARALAADAFLAKPVRWADLQSFLGAPAEGVREL